MSEQTIEDRIHEILLDLLDVSEENLRPEATFINDLGASSVDKVEIITDLENKFDLDISDEDAAAIRTVQNVIDYVKANAG